MLETKLPASMPLPRRAGTATAPRLKPRPGHATPVLQPLTEPPLLRRPSPTSEGSRLARSETRLLGLAVVCTALVCGLLVLYLAAYARVTQLGIQQSEQRTTLRLLHQKNQMLRYEYASMKNAHRIIPAAVKYGMVKSGLHVNYISPATPDSDSSYASPLAGSPAGSSVSDYGSSAENHPTTRGH